MELPQFASEHLNHDTQPHVIQALLGHAAVDTVMTYVKPYPATLVEAYPKVVRAPTTGVRQLIGTRGREKGVFAGQTCERPVLGV